MSTEFSDEPVTADDGVFYDEEVTPEYGILGFTLREILITGVWLIAFVASFFPLYRQLSATTVWTDGISWILPIGLPTAAVFLLVLRRLSPEGIRRVGSLGIDQFASVTFSVAAVYWATTIWDFIAATISRGQFMLSWVMIVQTIAMLALVVLTVFATLIPGIREDFQGRLVTLAHRSANPVRPVIARPRPERAAEVTPGAPVAPGAPVSPVAPVSPASDEDAEAYVQDDAPVPLTSHASGGELGTVTEVDESGYIPPYARASDVEVDGAAEPQQDIEVELEGEAGLDDEPVSEQEPESELVTEPEPEPVPEPELSAVLQSFFESEPESEPESVPLPEPAPEPDPEATRDTAIDPVPVTQPDPEPEPVYASQPFWALAATERDILDERGAQLFRIGPDAWALVIEDRGGAYVVRHDDGRVGYLHDIEDITRG